jgi:transposase
MILGTTRSIRAFAYPRPADLRNGYNGLFGLVKNGLARDPLSGELYMFVNRKRDACKVLMFDGTGLCIFQKRLARGHFASLWRDDGTALRLTASELALFIEGCSLVGRRALSPEPIAIKPLVSDRGL